MRIRRLTQPDERSTFQRRFEYLLLTIVLCVIALRTTHTETISSSGLSILIDYLSISYSLTFSVILFAVALIWFVVSIIRGELSFRISGFVSGFSIFTLVAVITTFLASDRRASINTYFTIAGCVVCGIFLVQMLKRISTIRFVVIVAAALAIVNCYEAFNQLTTSYDYMIEQFEENPEKQLNSLGIESNTLEAFLYEHRLYSKNIKGYFTTGNSLGSFLILTGFMTAGLIAAKVRRFIKTKQDAVDTGLLVFILFLQIEVLFLSTSKGALGAAFLGVALLVVWLFFRKPITAHRKKIFVLSLFAAGGAAMLVMLYAVSRATLPGGVSMLVRAEYWFATARMIIRNFFTGVGGGNFGYYYTIYKPPASIETVSDPHNMILSILAQYGIFGFIGFGMFLILPLTKVIVSKYNLEQQDKEFKKQDTKTYSRRVKYAMAIIIAVVLFIIRPILIPIDATDDVGVMLYIAIVMYAAPALIFLFVVWLLDKSLGEDFDDEIFQAATFCGIVAMLTHNIIDFAIFEPGVMIMLFLTMACFVAISQDRLNRFGWRIEIDRPDAALISIMAVSAFLFVMIVCYKPVLCATARLNEAFASRTLDVKKVSDAARCDRFDSRLLPFIARVFWIEAEYANPNENLEIAERYYSMAIRKNSADFKNYMNLARVRRQMADNTQTYRRKVLLTGAEDAYRMALARYPGNADLHLELGKTLFLQDRPDQATAQFEAALQIEQLFRAQFAKIFGDYDMVSRISPENYEFLVGVVGNIEE